ncbi:hypothetical protein BABINDRAFT_162552 [Babjeviella inositovora NRRL Y-12698]|uniref:Origin recognition complex subunit 1 n=1 Tax=Babjeviella inositovora NRRL Y-12698 TaxID=984486 RepID=A0A1E3QMH6_9ASCO|nr:uncharacterized protein BABINDRAFT_162552 [Babjeviella inositovora NRRL Y-12698]ODQ78885.1 hypothetical protein BABINDRAFT_162552 [Babjeviella inositovora NRRL Y-12698]
MASNPKRLHGWNYTIDTPDVESTPSTPRRRRGTHVPEAKVVLRRDGVELKQGDTVLVRTGSSTDVAIIKEIIFGTHSFIEITVQWFTRAADVDGGGIALGKNELLATAVQGKLWLENYAGHVQILSEKEARDVELDETTFMCCRGCDEEDGNVTKTFDWREYSDLALVNPSEFVERIRTLTVQPTKASYVRAAAKAKAAAEAKATRGPRKRLAKTAEISSEEIDETESDAMDESDTMDESDSEIDVDSGGDISDEEFTNKFYMQKRGPGRPPGAKNRVNRLPRKAGSPKKFASPRKLASPLAPRLSLPLTSLNPSDATFKEIKAKLHTSLKLRSLPCREDEFTQLYVTIEGAINTATGCCLYVSGTPGVGKTATVREVIGNLEELVAQGGLEEFDYCEINGLKLVSPSQAYEHLWQQISGEARVSAARAAPSLEAHFQGMQGARADDPRVARRRPLVVLMDELDQVVTKSQAVLYNFFNWPTYANLKLIVIAVANTMDLPERLLSNKVSSRLGLIRIQFLGYTFQQLTEIITTRLNMITGQKRLVVSKDAIEFAARKVANISGDARRALTVCRRAVEIAEARHEQRKAFSEPEVKASGGSTSQAKEDLENCTHNEVEKNGELTGEDASDFGTLTVNASPPNGEDSSSNSASDIVFDLQMTDVMEAINETISSPTILQLNALSFTAKLFLAALMLRHKRAQLAEVGVGDIIDEMRRMVVLNSANTKLSVDDDSLLALLYNEKGLTNLRVNQFHHTLEELLEMGILLCNSGSLGVTGFVGERHLLVKLNVSREEVNQALKGDKVLRGLI